MHREAEASALYAFHYSSGSAFSSPTLPSSLPSPHPPPANYPDLWQWSVEHYDLFWEELFLYTDILYSSPYDEVQLTPSFILHSPASDVYYYIWQVVDLSKSVADVPEWFRGCRLNYAENLLRYADSHGDKTAIISCGQLYCNTWSTSTNSTTPFSSLHFVAFR